VPPTRNRLRVMTFSTVANRVGWCAAKLPLTRSCETNVASAMLRRRKMNAAGRIDASPILASHRTWRSSFYDGGVLWSNSCIMS
jgi:hypothetical protein